MPSLSAIGASATAPPVEEEYAPPPPGSASAFEAEIAGTPPPEQSSGTQFFPGPMTFDEPPGNPEPTPEPVAGSASAFEAEVAGPPPSTNDVPQFTETGLGQVLGELGGAVDAAQSGNVSGVGQALGRAGNEAREGIGDLIASGPSGVKDAIGTQMAAQGGDPLPWRRAATVSNIEERYRMMQEGRGGEGLPGERIPDPIRGAVSHVTGGDIEVWMSENPDKVDALMRDGYTSPATGQHFTGPDAVWEARAAELTTAQRAAQDIIEDPSMLTVPLGILSAAEKVPAAVRVGARAVDEVANLGMGLAIEGGLKGAGKGLEAVGLLAPTAQQAAKTEAADVLESAGAYGAARRGQGELLPVVATEIAPDTIRLQDPRGLIPEVIYRQVGGQISGVVDDPTNLSQVRPLTHRDHQNISELLARVDPDQQAVLMNAGGRQVGLPDAAIGRPYLKSLQRSLPSTATGSIRGAIPTPQSGADLIALRAQLTRMGTLGNAAAEAEIVRTALRSGLLPPGTPATAADVANAIGVIEAARLGPTPPPPATVTALVAHGRRELDRVGLRDVGITVERMVTDVASGRPLPLVEGQYFNRVVTIATDPAGTVNEAALREYVADVTNHEVIHALRGLNLFRESEWNLLVEMAKRYGPAGGEVSVFDEVSHRYATASRQGAVPYTFSPDQIVEESVAELNRLYLRGELTKLSDVQRTLLGKIIDFFTALSRAVRGGRPESVLIDVQRGKIGGRRRGPSPITGAPVYQVGGGTSASPDPLMVSVKIEDGSIAPDGRRWTDVPDDIPGVGWRIAQQTPEEAAALLEELQQRLLDEYPTVRAMAEASLESLRKQHLEDVAGLKIRGGGMLLTPEEVDRLATLGSRERLWYEKSAETIRDLIDLPPEELKRFSYVLAGTSGGARPGPNTERALGLMSAIRGKRDSWVPTRSYQDARSAVQEARLDTNKFGNFGLTFNYLMGLEDDIPRAVIDVQMSKIFGLPDNAILTPRPELYDFLADYIGGVRDLLNASLAPGEIPWESWQVQAALWTDFRRSLGVQTDAYDDYASALIRARDQLGAAGLLEPDGRIGDTALRSPEIETVFKELSTAHFWKDAKVATMEAQTTLTPAGAAASQVKSGFLALDPNRIPTTVERGRWRKALDAYRGIELGALDQKTAYSDLFWGIIGRSSPVSQMMGVGNRGKAFGTYEGSLGANARIPLGSARSRVLLDDAQGEEALSWMGLGFDQAASAASRFETVPLGEHNAFSVLIGDASTDLTPLQQDALRAFDRELGLATSIKTDYLGWVVDIHTFDPERIPDIETIRTLYEKHLADAFPGVNFDVWPRRRSDIYVENYSQPIARSLDNALAPVRNAIARSAKDVDAADDILRRLEESVATVASSPSATPDIVNTAFKEISSAVSDYESSGGIVGKNARERISRLESGWSAIRNAAAGRDREFSKWTETNSRLLDHLSRSANFSPGPGAGQPVIPSNIDRVLERFRTRERGAPIETPEGPLYSVLKFRGFHGSPRTDLTVIKQDPPQHRFGTATSRMGALFSGDYGMARKYAFHDDQPARTYIAQPRGSIYEAQITLNKPYHMPLRELVDRWEWTDIGAIADGQLMREELETKGYDGIVAWHGGEFPKFDENGSVIGTFRPDQLAEVIIFRDTPVTPADIDTNPLVPKQNALGPVYSVLNFKKYHGSNRRDITVLKADMPLSSRVYPYASSSMGVFLGPNENVSFSWLPDPLNYNYDDLPRLRAARDEAHDLVATGMGYRDAVENSDLGKKFGLKIYETTHRLENAFDMSVSDMVEFYTPAPEVILQAQQFKDDLIAKGYDGIAVWRGRQLPGQLRDPGFDAGRFTGDIMEIISFDDVPVYNIAKGQFGSPPLGNGAPVIPGLYRRGSVEEYLGTLVADSDREILDRSYTVAGTRRTVWQTYNGFQDRLENARRLAVKSLAQPLTTAEQRVLDVELNQLRNLPEFSRLTVDDLAGWSDEAVDRLAAKRVERVVEQATGLRDAAGNQVDPSYYRGVAGRMLKAYDSYAKYRRTMALYSTTRGPAYVMLQALGNAFTLGLTNPSALRRYSPAQWNDLRRLGKDGAPTPYVIRIRDQVGLAENRYVVGRSRDELGSTTFFSGSDSLFLRGLGKIAAPQIFKDFADAWDGNLRAAAWRTVFEPGYGVIRKNLPSKALAELQAAAGRAGVPTRSASAFRDAIGNLPRFFDGPTLQRVLLEAAGDDEVAKKAVRRISADYVNDVRTLDRAAIEATNRVGFTFDETRLDSVLSRLFFFHYWISRASVLYLTEAARNPWQLQLWGRAMNAGNRRAESGIPQWQRDMVEFLQTPAGMTALFSPSYLVGTYLFFQEAHEPNPLSDKTRLGSLLEDTFLANPMLNPLLGAAIYITGGGGSDFSVPDVFGTGKWTSDLNVMLEKANKDIYTFYATEKGAPKVVPNLDSRTVLAWVGEQITQRGWESDFFGMAPVSGYDPSRGEQANLSYFILDEILLDNPGLNDGSEEAAQTISSLVEEALANPDSDYYQRGYERLVDMETINPLTGNPAIDAGVQALRSILPLGITSVSTTRREKQVAKNREQGTALQREMGYVEYATEEKLAFNMEWDRVRGGSNPAAQKAVEIYGGIKYGDLALDSIVIDGVTYTSDELTQFDDETRKMLAIAWAKNPQPEAGGMTGFDLMDLYYGERDTLLAENPDIANFYALGDYAESYPGGETEFVMDAAAANSNYRRYVEQFPPTLYDENIEEWRKAMFGVGGYFALTGRRQSRWDAQPLRNGLGVIPGLSGQSLAEWKAEQE